MKEKFLLLILLFIVACSSHHKLKKNEIERDKKTYEFCFNETLKKLSQLPSYSLSKNLFSNKQISKILKSEKKLDLWDVENPDSTFLLKYSDLDLSKKIDKKSDWDSLIQNIYSSIKSYNKELPNSKFKNFNISIEGNGLNLIAASSSNNYTLLYSPYIIESIYKKAMTKVFQTLYQNEMIDFYEEPKIFSPITYVSFIDNSDFPCLPFINKEQLKKIIFNDSILISEMDSWDSLALRIAKKTVLPTSNFPGEVIGTDLGDIAYTVLTSLVDSNKVKDAELKHLIRIAEEEPYSSDIFIELSEMTFFALIDNYINFEIEKIIMFTIAHEAYHTWYAPDKIGDVHEFNADKFAIIMYLNFYRDYKPIQHEFSKSIGINDTSMFDLMSGRPVYEIFEDVFKSTNFYEKPSAFHPPFQDRLDSMFTISYNHNLDILQYLENNFQN